MAGTTAADLKAALKSAMLSEAGLAGVPVSYGEPGDLARTEHVWIGSAVSGAQEVAVFKTGRTRRDEEYMVDVIVEVSSVSNPETCEARAVLLGTVIEEMLADDPKVNDVTGLLWCVVNAFDLDTQELPDGPVSKYTLSLNARGRIL